MKQLNADIKNNEFKRAYLLFGDESFLVHSYKQQFKKNITGDDDMNFAYYEGKDIDPHAVIDTAETLPFFAERKLIIIENSGWFKTSEDSIVEYIEKIPESTVMVFCETEVDKRNRLYKKVSSAGYACEFKHPTEAELSKWAAGILSKSEKKITLPDMQLFLSYTGLDMQRTRTELEKLICYVGDREVITKDDIEKITSVTEQNRVFDMVRAITSRKRKDALRLYDDLLALKEPPLRLLFLIARQFNQLLEVKDMMTQGSTKEEIAGLLGIPMGVAEGIMRQVRTEDRGALLSYVNKCVEMEEAVKLGNMPDRLAVEMIICGA